MKDDRNIIPNESIVERDEKDYNHLTIRISIPDKVIWYVVNITIKLIAFYIHAENIWAVIDCYG